RAFVQLIAVGFLLKFIFVEGQVIWTVSMILAMTFVGAYTSARRAKGIPKPFSITILAMLITVSIAVFLLLLLRIIPAKPMFLIPIAGMVIGNSMNTLSVAMIRLHEGIFDRREHIEAALAIGKSPRMATASIVKKSLRLSLIPRLDTVKVGGIIHLPGAMTGMILAGASPLEAVKFQIIIMYLIVGTPSIAAFIAGKLAYRRFFNTAEQLVLYHPNITDGKMKKRLL
ncbi:iron export ABC transporter permease subunit FetB, partial [bacterium]